MAGGVTEQRDASFDRRRHTGTAAPLLAPPKLFLAVADNTGVSGGSVGPVTMSPTSTLQAVTAGSPKSPAATAASFSRHGASSSSSSSGGDNLHRRRSHRPAWEWEAVRPAGLGLAGALNGYDPPAAAVQRGRQSFQVAAGDSSSSSPRGRLLSPWEMMEASEDYARVIDRGGKNTRTTHIFDSSRVVVDGCGGAGFLRWCHGCSKDLAQGKDIFMYRGEMAFCSHECRYREMLLLDEEY
ncbi:hypothetical protein HU200_021983 [Digitaria exilis]|uniref:FLZ-type domain-containing protein n=1 Tax=Digitaria exilis TaxID=1010633 RepID=A0A835C841_9POAL|nr:hypothetical protein HU200_021983 [Digitaria exilis]CAB3494676.1 unnamed protein product [Digitaria exilis]